MSEPREYREFRLRELTNQSLEVVVDKEGWRGEGLIRCADGWISVRGVLAGETLRITTSESLARPGKLYALVDEVLVASERRVDTGCPVFGRCAGCHLRHVDRDDERQFKTSSIVEILTKFSNFSADILPDVEWIAGGADGVRRRGSISRGSDLWGMRVPGSPSERIDVRDCPALLPEARTLLRSAVETLERHGLEGKVEWALGAQKGWLRFDEEITVEVEDALEQAGVRVANAARGDASIEARHAGLELIEGFDAWSHATRGSSDALYDWLREFLEVDRILELGCGIGTISILAASTGATVVGVDASMAATELAERNARQNLTEAEDDVRFLTGDFEKVCRDLAIQKAEFDLAIINPMREPTGARVMAFVDRLVTGRILYLAPSPAAASRDIECLRGLGWQTVERLAAIDLHPKTYHVMMGILLSRSKT